MLLTAELPSGTVARVVLPDGSEHRIGPGAFEASALLPSADLMPAAI